MRIEVFDGQGRLVDTLSANSRRGISRVDWLMRLKPPRVPPAASAAFEAAFGPRVVPGTYTVKMTRGEETYTTPLVVSLDVRAKFTEDDRRQDFEAVMRVYNLLGDMSFDVDRINGVRDALAARGGQVKEADPLHKQLVAMSESLDAMRRKIVATKEGGAITGEERIREKTSTLYGALTNYEGRPADYQLARIDSLKKELGDVETEFEAFVSKDLTVVNKSLTKKKLETVKPLARANWEAANGDAESGTSRSAAPIKVRH